VEGTAGCARPSSSALTEVIRVREYCVLATSALVVDGGLSGCKHSTPSTIGGKEPAVGEWSDSHRFTR